MKKSISTLFILSFILTGYLSTRFTTQVLAQGLGNCGAYDVKIEHPPFSYTGNVSSVTIKAGSQNQENACFTFTQDGDNGCYQVVGLHSGQLTVTKIGGGNECKDISHVELLLTLPSPTPSITPTPDVTPTATPGASISPIPSVIPSIVPTPEPSILPSIIPSQSPNPSPQNSPIPSLSPSPDLTPTPQPSPSPKEERKEEVKEQSVEKQYEVLREEVKHLPTRGSYK